LPVARCLEVNNNINLQFLILLPGNEIQRNWRNIRHNFRKELQLQKKVTSGQRARKRRKYIYFDQLLFLLPMMQRDTSGNITPPPSANESEAQDITTGNEMGECSYAKNATYCRQKKQRAKATFEKSLLETIKETTIDDIDEDRSYLMSGTVVQKAE
jgi:hypothetical protein